MYGTTATQKKNIRKNPLQAKAVTAKKVRCTDGLKFTSTVNRRNINLGDTHHNSCMCVAASCDTYYTFHCILSYFILLQRDDKRRATHNEVERRRRDKINSWITKLAAMVPNSGLPDTASKGGILAKACDHISELTEKQKRCVSITLFKTVVSIDVENVLHTVLLNVLHAQIVLTFLLGFLLQDLNNLKRNVLCVKKIFIAGLIKLSIFKLSNCTWKAFRSYAILFWIYII